MLKPSYSELMKILNNDPDLDGEITSRYAVVIAASKRARQLIDGSEPQATAGTNKAVSIAVMEMRDGLIKIFPDGGNTPDEIDLSSLAYTDTESDAVAEAWETVGVSDAFDNAVPEEDFETDGLEEDAFVEDISDEEDFGDDPQEPFEEDTAEEE